MKPNKIEGDIAERWRNRRGHGNVWMGIFILIIGSLLFARAAGVDFPSWLFTWPMILIALGLFTGLRHGFRHGPWFLFLIIGGIFLYDKIDDTIFLRPYLWPMVLIGFGLFIIFKPRRKHWRNRVDPITGSDDTAFGSPVEPTNPAQSFTDHSDVLDITAVFSGVKKKVLSKSFRGGDVVAVMGGTEIDLTQADFCGKIRLDSFTMFGGMKLIVPPDWEVQSEVVAIFGGVEDKRPPATHHDPARILYLEGTCIFGGIDIRSF